MIKNKENTDKYYGSMKMFHLKSITILVILIIAATICLALIVIPYTIEYGAENWLENHGVKEAEIGDINFNPFLGRMELHSFQARGSHGAELNIAKATLRFDWLGLLKHRFDVKEIILQDGIIDVQHHSEAGWLFGILPLQPVPEASDTGNNKQKHETLWDWGTEKFRLKNITIRFQDNSLKEDIIISEARIDHINTWQINAPGTIYLLLKKKEGTLAFKGKLRYGWNEKEKKFSIETGGDIQGNNILFKSKELQYTIANFNSTINSRLAVFKENVEDTYEFNIDGSVTIDGIQIHDLRKKLNMATIEKLTLNSFQMQQENFTMNTMKFVGVKLFQQHPDKIIKAKKNDYAASFHEVLLEKIDYGSKKGIEVADLQLKDAEWSLIRNQKGMLGASEWLAHPQKKKAADKKASSKTNIRIKQTRITGESYIRFEDHSLKTAYKETVGPFSLKVGMLDNLKKEFLTPIDFQTKIGKYSTFAISGTFLPFGEKLTMDLHGTLTALDVPSFNPYSVQYNDYRFDSGHADADIKWQIYKDELDSEINLKIKKLKYKRLNEGGEDRFKQATGIPFNYAVNLLRDKKNNIHVLLSVKGDIREPDFEYSDAFRQALVAAIKKATLSYYTPVGVTLLTGVTLPVGSVYVSGKLVKWVTKLRFKQVDFDRESTRIPQPAKEYLDTMAKLLLDRPKVNVVLCGKAVVSEIDHEEKEARQSDMLSNKEREYLLELARKRAAEVKEYLIKKNVQPEMLLICEPVIDDKAGAKARVDISL